MRALLVSGLVWIGAAVLVAAPDDSKSKGKAAPAAARAGIKTPGIQIAVESLNAEAEIPVETPGWITAGESVFVPNKAKDAVVRIDPKTNKTLDPVADLKKPCSGTVVAFGSLWIPNCGSQTVTRFDIKANKITA